MMATEKFVLMQHGPAPEDPREALVWLAQQARKLGPFFGGSFRPPAEGVYFDTLDPSTGEPLAAVAQGSAADIDAAVKTPRRELARWQSPPPHPRARHPIAPAQQGDKKSRTASGRAREDNSQDTPGSPAP